MTRTASEQSIPNLHSSSDTNGSDAKRWDFWIDRGGTFTDIVAKTPQGQFLTRKLLSENPTAYEDAALQGIRDFLNVEATAPIPNQLISSVKMGTTVATNALLERKGEPTVLIITAGLRDVLEIGYQVRPKTFALNIEKPEVLYQDVIEVSERFDDEGNELVALCEETVRQELQQRYEAGFRSVAIVLMHAYKFPEHELRIAAIAKEIGFSQISTSHDVSPMVRIVPRGDTTVVDAYLSPILRRYVQRVGAAIGAETGGGTSSKTSTGTDENTAMVEAKSVSSDSKRLQFMRSSGGLTAASKFQGRDAILSGPAGGIIGAVRTSELAGFNKIIGFDMGGTSTDVSHYAGDFERAFETQVAGVRMSVPMMSVHTVAAGGGSILHVDEQRFRVGPESAGAFPGPMSYRNGGPLTVTDANVCLGKVDPRFFPKLFGPQHNQAIDDEAVKAAFAEIAQQQSTQSSPEHVAEGFLTIAIEHMAQAIKKISIERGYDVQQYALTCFGGAGGQHACLVADRLGMQTIFIHPFASILSAYGMGLADIRSQRTETFQKVMDPSGLEALNAAFARLKAHTSKELKDQGIEDAEQSHSATVFLRYQGTDTTLPISQATIDQMQQDFEAQHAAQYGFISPDKAIIVESISMESAGGGQYIDEPVYPLAESAVPDAQYTTQVFSGGAWHNTPIYSLAELLPGHQVQGPAIIIEDNGTVIVEPNWLASMTEHKHLVLKKRAVDALENSDTQNTPAVSHEKSDPVLVEIFNNQFMSIAEQMGIVLRNTSSSVNIKERLDFSCAVFDVQGQLIANAPHIPVHLGSMDATVKVLIQSGLSIEVGDVFIHNDPFNGGSHLPDVTVITPIFDQQKENVMFFVASRAHHADIGGIAPGSMSPKAKTIIEEGVVIPCMKLVSKGRFLHDELQALMQGATYPVRNFNQNVADLQAQIGANRRGYQELLKLVDEHTLGVVNTYTQHIMDNAEESVRRTIDTLQGGEYRYEMDGGLHICVKVAVDHANRSASIDFTGTSPQQPNNFNAPGAITQAVVLYVFRCLVDSDIPLNAGCMRPLSILVPEGSMLNPVYPAAVVAGNVEVSQAATNALFGALGTLGMSQGTMNNLTFGNAKYQYYETICSGAPAVPGFDGAAAVHTHMTNSRLTDPEILESRYPVLLDKFIVRRGSGGKGQWDAGDGIERRIRFLAQMQCAILSGHREVPLAGVNGGDSGELGHNWIERNGQKWLDLTGNGETQVQVNDVVVIQTPTGGGFGSVFDKTTDKATDKKTVDKKRVDKKRADKKTQGKKTDTTGQGE
ncbi:5-oxoprolinase (ATP-hydrolyzing) [Paraglaciecola sp. T6c]|uniref:hydantoinase B/oxoprolinase family protein n=1 Tax=Pseudoalteromonas atlantica (strain T6c / ATCC BAA-1087) TaxID=3042615 RepID=UPI0000DA6E87|nr:hydantoinase B/oxoprolinase family protein [Paraglaciecola sp. T6c]ABG42314.1 5-oxoprolinase (ATP-hydrolyzing) [Paraglaciecola sp. T6c]